MYNGEQPTSHLNWGMVDFAEWGIAGVQTPAIALLAVVLVVWLVDDPHGAWPQRLCHRRQPRGLRSTRASALGRTW